MPYVADALIVQDRKILLVQQRKPQAYGLWSFPGGKMEAGETPEQAVQREIKEELGVQLKGAELFKTHSYTGKSHEILLHSFTGQIDAPITLDDEELLAYGWFSLEGLEAMLDKLRAPFVIEVAREVLDGS